VDFPTFLKRLRRRQPRLRRRHPGRPRLQRRRLRRRLPGLPGLWGRPRLPGWPGVQRRRLRLPGRRSGLQRHLRRGSVRPQRRPRHPGRPGHRRRLRRQGPRRLQRQERTLKPGPSPGPLARCGKDLGHAPRGAPVPSPGQGMPFAAPTRPTGRTRSAKAARGPACDPGAPGAPASALPGPASAGPLPQTWGPWTRPPPAVRRAPFRSMDDLRRTRLNPLVCQPPGRPPLPGGGVPAAAVTRPPPVYLVNVHDRPFMATFTRNSLKIRSLRPGCTSCTSHPPL
jgi:hypothetical protein